MDLKQKIIFERIGQLGQLNPEEQQQAGTDSELLALITELAELSQLDSTHGPAPNLETVLNHVFTQAEHHNEHKMSLLTRIFSGKRWYAQAALATLLLMAAATVFFASTSVLSNPLHNTSLPSCSASSSTTLRPALASSAAVRAPAGPPPTTAT